MRDPNGLSTLDILLELREEVESMSAKLDALCLWQRAIDTRLGFHNALLRWGGAATAVILGGIALRVFGP